MVLSDALVEEIFQTLIKLPFASVAPLVTKMQQEAQMQMPPPNPPGAVAAIAEREGAGKNSLPPEIAKFTRMPKNPKD